MDAPLKRRRLANACDRCKTRKVKCDSANMPNNICSNCMAAQQHCSHTKNTTAPVTSPREELPPITPEQRGRLVLLENTSARTLAASILTPTFNPSSDPTETQKNFTLLARYISALEKTLVDTWERPSTLSSSEGYVSTMSTPMAGSPADGALTGPESKDETEFQSTRLSNLRTGRGSTYFTNLVATGVGHNEARAVKHAFKDREDRFQLVHPWQATLEDYFSPRSRLEFPPLDLMQELVDLYFTRFNVFFPTLHRPSFERSIREGLHESDYLFGCTVLAACALGSRYSKDRRIFWEGSDTEHSCGWKWFRQIRLPRRGKSAEPLSVYQVQMYTLMSQFMFGSVPPLDLWLFISTGVRLVQDHPNFIRQTPETQSRSDRELMKRAYWSLIAVDIFISASLGRTRTALPDDLELELPTECDDEYWDHPDPRCAFQQPEEKPSYLAFWVHLLRLFKTFSSAQQVMHSMLISHGWIDLDARDVNEQVIRRLDSQLNQWLDSVPAHLRWDPNRGPGTFLSQSVLMYCTYYHLQIMIHRAFIDFPASPSARKRDKPEPFPSLAICANAARSCARVIQVQERYGSLPLPSLMGSIFNAALLLFLNHWAGSRAGRSSNNSHELDDVHAVINIMRRYERRWQSAARFCGVLEELLTVKDIKSLPRAPKRPPDDLDNDASAFREPDLAALSPENGTSFIQTQTPDSMLRSSAYNFTFPLHTNELGSLPIYEDMAMQFSNLTGMANSGYDRPNTHNQPVLIPRAAVTNLGQGLSGMSMGEPLQMWPSPDVRNHSFPPSQHQTLAYPQEALELSSSQFGNMDSYGDTEFPWDSWAAYMSSLENMIHS